jgi:hypothetical protein
MKYNYSVMFSTRLRIALSGIACGLLTAIIITVVLALLPHSTLVALHLEWTMR